MVSLRNMKIHWYKTDILQMPILGHLVVLNLRLVLCMYANNDGFGDTAWIRSLA